MNTVTITQMHQDVLDVIRASPAGCTDQEVAAALGIHDRTANGRRLWLQRHGLVEFAGRQDVGATVKRSIWRATNG
jgi:DNA-binding IclR family transcriptional regulator